MESTMGTGNIATEKSDKQGRPDYFAVLRVLDALLGLKNTLVSKDLDK